jgi:hypothetical protein
MHLQPFDYLMWSVSSVISLIGAGQLWKTSEVRRFPIFFAYLVLVGAHGLLNLALSAVSPILWFYSFYIGALLTTLLGFAVLYESARTAVSTPAFNLDRSTYLFLCAVGAVVAVVVSVLSEVHGPTFVRMRILFEVALRIMQLWILGIFATVSILFGLFWRRVEFGVVLGYGVYAAAQVSVMFLRAQGAANSNRIVTLAPMISYLCASLIWLSYASARQSAVDVDTGRMASDVQESLLVAQRLNR